LKVGGIYVKDYKLTDLLRKHHPETFYHSLRVAQLCFQVAKRLLLTNENCLKVMQAGLLHDIGKISVPVRILSLPTKLNEQEFAIVKQHVVIGVEILKNLNYDPEIISAVVGHHEREDGRGYPFMNSNAQIHEFARIVAVCDVYDAMTEKRSYKQSLEKKEVLRMMDEDVLGAFHSPSVKALCEVYQENVEEVIKFVIN
jgi:putative nucleotidyltransferase with HDIG domain